MEPSVTYELREKLWEIADDLLDEELRKVANADDFSFEISDVVYGSENSRVIVERLFEDIPHGKEFSSAIMRYEGVPSGFKGVFDQILDGLTQDSTGKREIMSRTLRFAESFDQDVVYRAVSKNEEKPFVITGLRSIASETLSPEAVKQVAMVANKYTGGELNTFLGYLRANAQDIGYITDISKAFRSKKVSDAIKKHEGTELKDNVVDLIGITAFKTQDAKTVRETADMANNYNGSTLESFIDTVLGLTNPKNIGEVARAFSHELVSRALDKHEGTYRKEIFLETLNKVAGNTQDHDAITKTAGIACKYDGYAMEYFMWTVGDVDYRGPGYKSTNVPVLCDSLLLDSVEEAVKKYQGTDLESKVVEALGEVAFYNMDAQKVDRVAAFIKQSKVKALKRDLDIIRSNPQDIGYYLGGMSEG